MDLVQLVNNMEITIGLTESENKELELLEKHLEGHKYEEYLKKCFSFMINEEETMFTFDVELVDRVIKSMINLRRETYNNPRVLKLRDEHGVDIDAQLVPMVSGSFKMFLYTTP